MGTLPGGWLMAIKRFVPLALGVTVLLWGCGGGEMSLTEYVDGLNAIEDQAHRQVEALQAESEQISTPSDLKTTLDRVPVIRIEALEAAEELTPPGQVADLHRLIFDWQAKIIPIEEALAARAGTVADWDELDQSPEMAAYRVALVEGKTVCTDVQAKLDATADRGAFADTPWIPGDLKEVVEAFLGCETYPENPEDAFKHPPATSAP